MISFITIDFPYFPQKGTFKGHSSPHLTWLCEELQTQSSLLEINLSNNGGGDVFAYALGGVLRKNRVLAAIGGDGNGVSMGGFRIIRASMFDNTSLQVRFLHTHTQKKRGKKKRY